MTSNPHTTGTGAMSEEANPKKLAAMREAEKRERHKPKSLAHKTWQAVHTPERGWHVGLVESPRFVAVQARQAAADALAQGNLRDFIDLAGEALLAQCRAELAENHAESAS